MNLLGRKLSIKQILKPGIILLIPVFLGCETSEDLGLQYNLGSSTNVEYVEFVLPATNMYIDSLRTDNVQQILVGNYTDDIGGSLSAEGYFQFFYQTGPMPREEGTDANPITTDTLRLDSMVLTFESINISPLNTTSFQAFDVYTLQDSLINSAIYLSNLEANTDELIGSFSRSINTATDTIYRIKLTDSFAGSFFNQLRIIAQDPDRAAATEVFKSLGIVPQSTSESIAAFSTESDTSRLIVYTSPLNPDAKDTTYQTVFRFNGKKYTYLDRSMATYGQSKNEDKTRFNLPGNETVIDPMYGLSTVYSVEPLREFMEQNNNIFINNAVVTYNLNEGVTRDTLINFYTFFEKENGIFGPSTVTNSFANMVMNDVAYTNGQNIPSISSLSPTGDRIQVNSTLFFQTLYNSYQEFGDLVFKTAADGSNFPLSEFVLISQSSITTHRTTFPENGITLRLYYTEIN